MKSDSCIKFVDGLEYAFDVARRLGGVTEKEYLIRKEKSTRRLHDEEWPLATYAKILYHPNRKVKVAYLGNKDNSLIDGKLKISGMQKEIEGWPDITPVEITTARFRNAHLLRKEQALKGFSFGPEGISESRKKGIENKPVVRNMGEDFKQIIPIVQTSLENKYKATYPKNTTILCAIFPEVSFSISEWATLEKELYSRIATINYKTVLLDTFTCYSICLPNQE